MRKPARISLFCRLGMVVLLGLLFATPAHTQDNDKPDPEAKPTFGQMKLKAGFAPDPFKKELLAGGELNTKLGGVAAWVAKAPDFKLFYEAGKFSLTIHAESDEDTTLLINLPDGTWVANDDGKDNGLNPLLRFEKPQSGRYDIWVGTFKKGITPKAKLLITELK